MRGGEDVAGGRGALAQVCPRGKPIGSSVGPHVSHGSAWAVTSRPSTAPNAAATSSGRTSDPSSITRAPAHAGPVSSRAASAPMSSVAVIGCGSPVLASNTGHVPPRAVCKPETNFS
ncbi:hypothetical protein tb265_40990 [Gemmatimonadetes bacterium T265]|nr:hypothetical protein tb265_40990 [Gemmatimonadetes bacterium T265]